MRTLIYWYCFYWSWYSLVTQRYWVWRHWVHWYTDSDQMYRLALFFLSGKYATSIKPLQSSGVTRGCYEGFSLPTHENFNRRFFRQHSVWEPGSAEHNRGRARRFHSDSHNRTFSSENSRETAKLMNNRVFSQVLLLHWIAILLDLRILNSAW